MIITISNDNATEFRKIFLDLATKGKRIAPRNLPVLELENYNYILSPYNRFCNFERRNLHIQYIKEEFKWYLKGDRFDASICEHAKIWLDTVNSDGSFNSNYGQYVFGTTNQFDRAFEALKNDKDSRRASIMILSKDHLLSDTKDIPCTYAINFRIRENKLNMTVRMRSQDAIYGMGNDVACFSFMQEMMYNSLKEFYPELEYGKYYHSADSFHVYERHFKMLEDITNIPIIRKQEELKYDDIYVEVNCPVMNGPEEVKFLRKHDFTNIQDEFQFTKWLCNGKNL